MYVLKCQVKSVVIGVGSCWVLDVDRDTKGSKVKCFKYYVILKFNKINIVCFISVHTAVYVLYLPKPYLR